MFEIKNLTKIYKTSKQVSCRAVDDVSINLPSEGMIFITGKSGSGKSTLLNMIGTLDNITSGDIIVDGNSFTKFNDKDFQEYRSSYLGFIFQDFLLLEELTVKENIGLALNISGIEQDDAIDSIIKRVGLVGMEDKFPSELSGGQRQRVAIARALIKNPRMLLCDEPTGNLDYKTSKQILNILKAEAKEKLVLIVSHNLEDAEIYGDRIIELNDGKIKRDYTKNKEYTNVLVQNDNYIILPHHKDLTTKEIDALNEKVKTTKFKVIQNNGGFFPTKEVEMEKKEFILHSSHLSHKNSVKLSSMFFRKNKHGAPYTIFITSLFISLFYIFQVFISFSGNRSLQNEVYNKSLSVINLTEQTRMGTLSASNILPITDLDVDQYEEAGYTGEIYKLYNYGPSIDTSILETNRYTRYPSMFNYNTIKETLGTLCCTEEYLTNLYGVNGKLVVLAGNLDDAYNKIIITDYIADCLIVQTKAGYTDYEECLVANKNKVAAIIFTGYKERHQDVIKSGEEAQINGITTRAYMEENSKNEKHIAFLNEVHDYLSICYTFTDDFYQDIYNQKTITNVSMNNIFIQKEHEEIGITNHQQYLTTNSNIKDGDIQISYTLYNELFGTFYNAMNSDTFVPHKITLKKYINNSQEEGIIFEQELNVVSLGNSTITSLTTYEELVKEQIFVYGLYFDNLEQKELIYNISEENGFLISSIDTGVVPVVNTMLELFRGFCYLIISLLFVVSFVHIVFYGINSIKKNIYEIGVLKALGAKNFDVGKIFIIQIAIMGIGISIVSILGIYLSTIFSNMLLVSAFEDFMTITIFNLKVIIINPKIMTLDLTLVFILSIISSIIPLIYLRTIKPLNILKGKKK